MNLPMTIDAMNGTGATQHSPSSLDLATVYATYFSFVFRAVRRLGVAPASQDDAVQEVFLVVHTRLASFEGRSSLKTWLYGILLHVVRAHRRRAARDACWQPLEDDVHDQTQTHPDEAARKSEAARVLYRFLATLDDQKREVFVLCELEQMTLAEAAQLVGSPMQTVYSRLQAARHAFEAAAARYQSRENEPWNR